MKKLLTIIVLNLVATTLYSQSWDKGGNNPSANPFTIGSNTSDAIFMETEDELRVKLNPDVNYTINGYAGDRDGFMLLGTDGTGPGQLFANDTLGAFSQLHLTSMAGVAPSNGYRPWMRTGVTYTSNSDLSYMGMRTVANSVTETVVAWANDGLNQWGPDDLCFRFIGGGEGNNVIGPATFERTVS